jgi:hypothetical protein
MRHSSKELEQVQDVIDQEKQIVLAKLEDLNRRDAGKHAYSLPMIDSRSCFLSCK